MPSPTITVEEVSILQAWADKHPWQFSPGGGQVEVTTPPVGEGGVP